MINDKQDLTNDNQHLINDNQDRFLRNIRKALGHPPNLSRRPPETRVDEKSAESGAEFEAATRNEAATGAAIGAATEAATKAAAEAMIEAEIKNTLERIASRTLDDRMALLQRLVDAGRPLNLQVTAVNDPQAAASAIADLVLEKVPEWGTAKSVAAWRHPLIDELNLPETLSDQNVPVYFSELEAGKDGDDREMRQTIRQQIIDSFIGVTSADFCLADTATLVLKTRPNHARAVSLVPVIHVAVIRLDQLLSDLKELYTVLKHDPQQKAESLTTCMTLISGPSKTADIELVMVHGAHGPRELHLFVITG